MGRGRRNRRRLAGDWNGSHCSVFLSFFRSCQQILDPLYAKVVCVEALFCSSVIIHEDLLFVGFLFPQDGFSRYVSWFKIKKRIKLNYFSFTELNSHLIIEHIKIGK